MFFGGFGRGSFITSAIKRRVCVEFDCRNAVAGLVMDHPYVVLVFRRDASGHVVDAKRRTCPVVIAHAKQSAHAAFYDPNERGQHDLDAFANRLLARG